MSDYDPIDFERNSVGVMVVRVIRIKDIVKTLSCSEEMAQQVVREIRGDTSADGSLAFVLPSQLARWTYARAGQPTPLLPFKTVAVKATDGPEALKRARRSEREDYSNSGSNSLKEIRSDLRRLKSATIQPGTVAITAAQAAARLGCSRSRVFEFLKEGRLKRAPRLGRLTMLTLASVDLLLETPGAEKPPRSPRTQKPLKASALKEEVLALKAKYR